MRKASTFFRTLQHAWFPSKKKKKKKKNLLMSALTHARALSLPLFLSLSLSLSLSLTHTHTHARARARTQCQTYASKYTHTHERLHIRTLKTRTNPCSIGTYLYNDLRHSSAGICSIDVSKWENKTNCCLAVSLVLGIYHVFADLHRWPTNH